MDQGLLCCSCAALSWFCTVLDDVNVTMENAEVFGSVQSGEGGTVGGGWRCCRSAPGLPQLHPAAPKNPPPFIASLFLFCFCRDGSTASGRLELNLLLSEKRSGKSYFGIFYLSAVSGIWIFCIPKLLLLPTSMQTKQDLKEHVLLMTLTIMLHAKLCLSVNIFLVLVSRKNMQGTVY
jgi:hypothetical protein